MGGEVCEAEPAQSRLDLWSLPEEPVCRMPEEADPAWQGPPAPDMSEAPPQVCEPEAAHAALGHWTDAFWPPTEAAATTPAAPAAPPAPVETRSDDPALRGIRESVNRPDLAFGQRAGNMLDYRNKQIGLLDIDGMQAMKANRPDMPMYASGDKKGMQHPLYEKLASDPRMQTMMAELAKQISSADPDKLDINEIWKQTQASAMRNTKPGEELAGNTADSNLLALQAMATLGNSSKFIGKDGKDNLPPEIAGKLPPALWKQIQAASDALTHSKSPNAAVMSHDTPAGPQPGDAPFSADNNFHFFSHAYLSASLSHQHGIRPHQAEAMSAFSGAQYELGRFSLAEHSGNSGLKDIWMNAEGAAFGSDLMATPGAALPGKFDGPPIEDRSIPGVERLPDDVRAISTEADDLSTSGLAASALQGAIGRKIDSDIEFQRRTGIPPAPSPNY